ncbi:hypothetical protein XMIN_4062 [Xanthomonas citri pv. mangiferaeindicae LMG 941]|nr:hypothetical protein XMIN_4062 [Xanthomonas citri pv. mangiferaeindicae LMG 941]
MRRDDALLHSANVWAALASGGMQKRYMSVWTKTRRQEGGAGSPQPAKSGQRLGTQGVAQTTLRPSSLFKN